MMSFSCYTRGWVLTYRDFNEVIGNPVHHYDFSSDLTLNEGPPNQALAALK